MEQFFLRIARSVITVSVLLGAITKLWVSKLARIVPEPYLDEYFHVRQAEMYLQGQWDAWHPKITTPPGLYIISYIWISLAKAWHPEIIVNTATFRDTNFFAAFIFLVHKIRTVIVRRAHYHDGERGHVKGEGKLRSKWSLGELNHAVLNICIFPPLFFFYGLFYTDVISALLVIMAYQAFFKGRTKSLVVIGLSSLFFRQTNIFWVSIFLGGLQVSRTLFLGRPGVEFPERATIFDVIVGSWQHFCIYDPLISQAWLEDYAKCGLSVAIASLSRLPKILRVSTPYILLLNAFGAFVYWNRGVVLGDKENHIASLHLPQMLYIWPYFMFFSFPLLYPYVLTSLIPPGIRPNSLRSNSFQHRLPRLIILLPIATIMLTVIHYNTIVHPFTLSDNRHYIFYIFRLLLLHPSLKYASVPIYLLCAHATISSLGGPPNLAPQKAQAQPKPTTRIEPTSKLRFKIPSSAPSTPAPGNRVSFVLIWLLATSLSLITAPLVEPRYFIIPWLIWRIHIPNPRPDESPAPAPLPSEPISPASPKPEKSAPAPPSNPTLQGPSASSQSKSFPEIIRAVLYQQHDHRLWLETGWFLAVNGVTGYVFLWRGFEWDQEPGKVQRFMW